MDIVKSILGEYKIHNADINLKIDATTEDLIDVIEGNRVYIPCIYLLNKIDEISTQVNTFQYILEIFRISTKSKCLLGHQYDRVPGMGFFRF